jgi:hypothetical protein
MQAVSCDIVVVVVFEIGLTSRFVSWVFPLADKAYWMTWVNTNGGILYFISLFCDLNVCTWVIIRGTATWIEPGSSVSIVSGYGLVNRAIEVRSKAEATGFILKPLCPDRFWGPPSVLYNGFRGAFKARPGRDTEHSSPSSAEFENE